ncbi:MAG: acetolactate decarboxylase [Thermodesulfobacteriota bacterium]
MKKKAERAKSFNLAWVLIAIMIITFHSHSTAEPEQEHDSIFQASLFEALVEGVYEGDLTYGELKKHGDFGLGTFNRLDGEMVGVDGVFYRIDSDGKVSIVEDSMKSPFAIVTFFDANETLVPDRQLNCEELKQYIKKALPEENIFYAIKVSGEFEYLKTRSVHAQEKPYPPISQAVKEQSEFDLENIKGTIAGYWFPLYISGVSQSGFHFHFISDDKQSGGHVLECKTKDIVIEIDHIRDFQIDLSDTEDFNKADLQKESKKEK